MNTLSIRPVASARKRELVALVLLTGLFAATTSAVPARAHTDTSTSSFGISSASHFFYPNGANDDDYNGYRVYLSSPRHSNSGNRGECLSQGHEENVNGRRTNVEAANGEYIGTNRNPSNHLRNLHARGYYVTVSPNSRDGNYRANRTESRNFGSAMHIVTHTNASPGGGCPSSTNRLEVLYQDANDKTLADLLVSYLDPATPGSARTVRRTDLAELGTNRPWGDAYVELQFHDNEAGQSWIYNSIETATYRYGVAVDQLLNYP